GAVTSPGWGPTSRGMAFIDTADPAWNVYRQDFGGAAPVHVSRFASGRLKSFDWSPDGKRLAVARRDGSATNAWIMEADGSHPVQVTHFSTEEIFNMVWLPNSRGMVVGAGTSNKDAVLIRNFR